MSIHQDNKTLVLAYYAALEHATTATVAAVLEEYTSEDYQFYGVYPWGELHGAGAVAEALWQPLLSSWQALQRRQDVFMAGTSEIDGAQWVTSMGHFMGLRDGPWLGIPATRKIGFLRYADFNCVRDGKICRTGFFCDIISVMSQAGCNPLPAQTGASFIYPGPRPGRCVNWVGRSSPGAKSALYLCDTDAHLFAARHFQQAVERDLNWFERHR